MSSAPDGGARPISATRHHLLRLLRVFARCFRLLHPVRWHLAGLIAGFAVLALLLLIPTLMLADTMWTRVLQGQPLTEAGARFLGLDPALTTSADSFTLALRKEIARRAVAVIGLITVLVTPAFIALYYYRIWILQRINHLLRLELVDRLQELSLRFHAESRVGDAIYRVYQDSATVTQLIDVLIFGPLIAGGRLLFSLAIVFLFDPYLALLLLCLWPPALIIGLWFSGRLRAAFRLAREANSSLTSRIQETMAGVKVLKANGAAALEQARFEHDSRAAFAAAFRARNLFATLMVLVFWATAAALLVAAGWAALATNREAELFARRLFVAGGLTAWNVGLFSFFKDRFGDGTTSVRRLFRLWARAQDIGIGLQRVFEILDTEPEVRDRADAVEMDTLRSSIEFHDVSFGYDADRPVLHDINFTVRPGTITAVVGPTGSGKTTLMALLLRLFDPQSGAITFDGVDSRRLRVDSLRHNIAIALQESPLFQATVRENIAYAAPGASAGAIRAAAEVACAAEFIEALPQGYDTVLGERGSKLSVGQRQRLNIARAVLKDTSILLLDEPTAALDAETELRVLRNLEEWGRARAIVIITHRLSTIRRSGQIVVLRDGRVAECGSHSELMARRGAYRRLVDLEEFTAPLRATGV
jgi:ABC-type multidrug transport system fused ATPase/permease subunit